MKKDRIIGIDEAGRGPLAGPVSVAAVSFCAKDAPRLRRMFSSIRGKDSKKLTHLQRKRWFAVIMEMKKKGTIDVAQTFVSAAYIDRRGIVPAVFHGVERSLEQLGCVPDECVVLLDGSLRAPETFRSQRTIVRGDEKELAIQLASIVAKVVRDKNMVSLAKKHPVYGFETHKGYGTVYHRMMIREHGPCAEHRKSFLRNIVGRPVKT